MGFKWTYVPKMQNKILNSSMQPGRPGNGKVTEWSPSWTIPGHISIGRVPWLNLWSSSSLVPAKIGRNCGKCQKAVWVPTTPLYRHEIAVSVGNWTRSNEQCRQWFVKSPRRIHPYSTIAKPKCITRFLVQACSLVGKERERQLNVHLPKQYKATCLQHWESILSGPVVKPISSAG